MAHDTVLVQHLYDFTIEENCGGQRFMRKRRPAPEHHKRRGENYGDRENSAHLITAPSFSFLLRGIAHTKRKGKCMDLVVTTELCPRAVDTGLRHEAFECNVWTSAQLLQIR